MDLLEAPTPEAKLLDQIVSWTGPAETVTLPHRLWERIHTDMPPIARIYATGYSKNFMWRGRVILRGD